MKNVFKYCPNCKSEDTIFVHNHRFECHTCQFVYYHNVATAVALIIRREDVILFTRRANEPMFGKLDLPGGFVDPGECAEIAAKRELWEELKIQHVPKLTYFTSEPNTYMFRGIQYRTCDICFIAEIDDTQTFDFDVNELLDFEWIKTSEIDVSQIGFQSIKKIIKQYLEKSPA